AKIVHGLRQIWQVLRHPRAALPALGELALRPEHVWHPFDKRKPFALKKRVRTWFAVELFQFPLEVECLQMRWRASKMDINHPLCFSGKICMGRFARGWSAGEPTTKQRVEGNAADASHAGLEEKPPCLKLDRRTVEVLERVHDSVPVDYFVQIQ